MLKIIVFISFLCIVGYSRDSQSIPDNLIQEDHNVENLLNQTPLSTIQKCEDIPPGMVYYRTSQGGCSALPPDKILEPPPPSTADQCQDLSKCVTDASKIRLNCQNNNTSIVHLIKASCCSGNLMNCPWVYALRAALDKKCDEQFGESMAKNCLKEFLLEGIGMGWLGGTR